MSFIDALSANLRQFCINIFTLGSETRCTLASQKFAEAYPNTIFVKFYGNSNEHTKKMIQDIAAPNTPHFTLWRNGASAVPALLLFSILSQESCTDVV